MTAVVAIVGRPNVGKSTLFNRLVGKRMAIVDDAPGVTRDRREAMAQLGDLSFRLVDTAGLEEAAAETLAGRMRSQTERAVAGADLVLFLIDARAGLTPADRHFAAWLRRSGKPTLLVANKSEGKGGAAGIYESFELGFGEPVPISAEHGEGLGELIEAMRPHLESAGGTAPLPAEGEAWLEESQAAEVAGESEDEAPRGPIAIAVIGRPNVGKSTLVNRLLGEERVVTGPEAGITRDPIAIDWDYGGRKLRLIDTAGLRRRARVSARIEQLSGGETLRALRFAEIALLLLDATQDFDKQDLTIARQVLEEGRALVIAANKWDAVADKQKTRQAFEDRLERSLPQARGVPLVPISAEKGQGIDRLMRAVFAVYEAWNRRVATADLNRWLAALTERHPPPRATGGAVKIRYMTQIKIRPPTFALFLNRPRDLPEAYLRYLANGLRETFGLDGVPLRLVMRKGDNPYSN
jgi:GTP-binding protein